MCEELRKRTMDVCCLQEVRCEGRATVMTVVMEEVVRINVCMVRKVAKRVQKKSVFMVI